MKHFHMHWFCVFFLTFIFIGLPQISDGQSFSDSLMQDERDIVVAIAPYTPEVRSAILDVAQFPQTLVKLERIQSRSSQSFQDLMAVFPQEEQAKFYELSRFPEIMDQMAKIGPSKATEIKALLQDYPAKTQEGIIEVYLLHFEVLTKMNVLYQTSQKSLEDLTASYPLEVQNDFKILVSKPDVLGLLTDNIHLTVSLGESYKNDPMGVKRQVDSLSHTLESQNTKELETYKMEVESNPKLQIEMKNAAHDYSTANNHSVAYVTNNPYDNYPYLYWFSYPSWYISPIWYPQPVYYQTGYYVHSNGSIVVVGLPSRGYSNWFFNSGYRRYPLIYNHYRSYYVYHRNYYNTHFYHGFYHASHQHFSSVHGINRNNLDRSNRHFNRPTNGNRSIPNSQMNPYNHKGFQHFHAGSFHHSGWNHVGGERGGAHKSGGQGRGRH